MGDIEYNLGRPETFVEMYEQDAMDLLEWLGFPSRNFGFLPSSDLKAKCKRRLWDEARNHDPAVTKPNPVKALYPSWTSMAVPQTKTILRPAGFLRARTQELLKLAERAGDVDILYSS